MEKGDTFALLLGIQIGAATVENSMEIPQKIRSVNKTLKNVSENKRNCALLH